LRKDKRMPRFIFFYTMTDDAERVRDTVPAHVAYWREARLEDYQGGPFADRSGGLITFTAAGREEAAEMVERDPFLMAGVIGQRWVKEWIA
jgi:uncharacterized protein YciI